MELNTEETKLSQIPESLRLLAKQTLKIQMNLDSDKTYINVAHGTKVSSENLTDALLKKSIGEKSLLSHPLARLYSSPESTNLEDQIQGLEIENVKTLIDQSIPILIHAHFQQLNALWESNAFSPLQELLSDPVSDLLKALVEKSSLVERVYQIDSMYPNLKQSVTSYFSQKLRTLYGKDIHPDAVNILFFKKEEENSFAFLSLTLTKFILNYFSAWFFYSYYLSEQNIIQVKLSQDAQNIALSEIFQASDITAIKSKHQERLGNFWQKNTSNYRILAKFSYLKTLLEQQNSASKLSFTALELACQAMGFDQENIKRLVDINEISLEEIPLNILEVLSDPKQVEVSSFLVNDQISSDILKVCDPITKHSLLYIPGYTPSFIEAKDERVLNHWVLHQAQLPTNLSSIASHFPHSSRMINNIKLDAFLYQDYRVRENLGPIFTKKDIFSFITEKQKERIIADLHVHEIPISFQYTYFPNYESTDSAFFTTITAAIEYIPYLFPNIHNRAYDLHELFPLPQETAVKLIKKEVKDKLHLDIDPDKTFIGYFIPEKIPHPPGESPSYKMLPRTHSLTEATLSNYRIGFTLWSSSTIVFTDSSGQGKAYPLQSQLLNILPKDIEEIIQKIDLETLHKNKLNAFWNKHVDRVKFFVKHRYLQQALQEYHNNTLSEENFKIISEAAFYSLHLEEEGVAALINPNMRIEIVSIANYQSTDIFVFRDTSKEEVLLYIAGNENAFFTFTNYEACICFLEENAKKDVKWQELLTSHFSIDVQDLVLNALKKGSYIDSSSLGSTLYPRPADCSFKNPHILHIIKTKPIEKSLFETIQKNTQERSYLDANAVITSDKELMLKRMALVLDSLGRALLVPSFAFPIVNWATLALLATESALNLYIAKNGDTVKERYQAAIDIGTISLEFLLLGAFLNFRSLQLSRHQKFTNQVNIRAAARGSGLQPSLKKTPTSKEAFFGTTKIMQTWQIAVPNTLFSHLDVKAWFLDEEFLLFTGKSSKAKHLIISSHGGYFPGTGIVKVPKKTELVVLGPHGWAIFDPKTENIAKKLVLPYGIINENAALPTQSAFLPSMFSHSSNVHFHPKEINVKYLAGTDVPGHIRNYSLSKYQTFEVGGESYLDIAQLVGRSRHPFPHIYGIGLDPVDVLTVRNRRGMISPNLEDVFKSLQNNGIHYERITLEFCRANIFLSMSKTKTPPRYRPAKL